MQVFLWQRSNKDIEEIDKFCDVVLSELTAVFSNENVSVFLSG